jgi:hypothetical protein
MRVQILGKGILKDNLLEDIKERRVFMEPEKSGDRIFIFHLILGTIVNVAIV